MQRNKIVCKVFLALFLTCGVCAAQQKERVEISSKIIADDSAQNCQDLKLGRALSAPKLAFPAEAKLARIGGTVLVTAKIDEKGSVSEIPIVSGNQILQKSAVTNAAKLKFTTSLCDGKPTSSIVFLTYNFIPFLAAEKYFTPVKAAEFIDLKNDSPFYEAILNLTENYKLAFGFEDRKFYADAPLTRGEFAHFLRSTLDLLSVRAAAANKIPREINLFYARNPQKIISPNNIKDLKRSAPFYDSVRTLLLKYDIALTDDKSEFQGSRVLTNNELIDSWSEIFGTEAIPVNSAKTSEGDRIVSRGEFALFLEESLQVLTYKTLP